MTDVPGLQTIDLDYVNAYLVETEHGRALIDTGDPSHADRVLAAIGDGPLDLVILTHAHGDHSGSLEAVLAATGAKLVTHTEEAALLAEGFRSRDMVAAPFCPPHIREATNERQRFAAPIQVDHAIGDGEAIPGLPELTAVHTPGHSAGHIALLFGDVLIVGDAVWNVEANLTPPAVAEDYGVVAASIEKLAGLDVSTAVFGHGPPLTGGVGAGFRGIGAVAV
jgi:glyoxylase-like metal-dependent hydrolase (beta-lactamase superfamily II)